MNAPHVSPVPSRPRLQLHQVQLQRGRTVVFEDWSVLLDTPRIGLIGDNGAGKTSLLRMLCGLEVPSAGQVTFNGHDLHAAGAERVRWVGMMFQNPDDQIIYPTVVEELALGLRPQGLSKREALQQARMFLQQHGLQDWAERAVTSLSQGQRQQVCWLALQLAAPQTLLLDEPFASLDLPGQARLARAIDAAPQQVLVSTHLLEHVRHFERVIWLERGRVRGDGPGAQVCAAYEADVQARMAAEH